MAGHIELRNNANAPFSRISDNLARLILRVEEAIGSHLMQLGEPLALDPKSLVFSQMPVKDIELDRGHCVKVSLEHFHGLVVARHINQKTAPWQSRVILNLSRRQIKSISIGAD